MAAINVRDGKRTVTLLPTENQTQAEVDEDIARSFGLLDHLQAEGVEAWVCEYRTYGRLRVARTKEVGPPPWPFPKAKVEVTRSPFHLMLGAGWRSTCHSLHVVWRSENGRSDP